jgi:hypothetical protein
MKNTISLVLLLLTLGLTVTSFEGCTTRRAPARFTWVGKPAKNLVYHNGPPTTTRSDDNGGQIFIYTQNQTVSTQYGAQQSRKSTLYYVNPYGIIYHILIQNL